MSIFKKYYCRLFFEANILDIFDWCKLLGSYCFENIVYLHNYHSFKEKLQHLKLKTKQRFDQIKINEFIFSQWLLTVCLPGLI